MSASSTSTETLPDCQARAGGGFRWNVPARYNIAQACCGRWAVQRNRFALYYEDETSHAEAWTFWDIQQAANRLSNVLGAMGTMRGDRVAILLPQRPQAAIAHMACYQMGAIAVPLAPTCGAATLASRLAHAEARVAIVDATALENLAPVRATLPQLKHVIGVAGARESWVREWDALLPLASSRYTAEDTAAADAALILHAPDNGGNPPGAPMAQRALLGRLPGFVCAHDFYPQEGDLFWSPVDWAEGLFDNLLPVWHCGQPLLAYRGGFAPEQAFRLIEKYGVRNVFLPPAALEAMKVAVPQPRARHDLRLRSIVSGGGVLDTAVREWARAELGVTINEMFGQAEINDVTGGCGNVHAPGGLGRIYPGHQTALLGADGGFGHRGQADAHAAR